MGPKILDYFIAMEENRQQKLHQGKSKKNPVPELAKYNEKEAIMRSVVCMFDSGYTPPQGRKIINYYYPLQYGIDGIIDFCKRKIDEVAGYPDMDRLYFYKAVIIALEGVKTWVCRAKFIISRW
jgi:hypothetical protein